MPTIKLSYLDLSPEQRREGAKAVRARIKATLANPNLAKEQVQQLKDQLQKIDSWEAGTIKATTSAPVKLPGSLVSKTPAELQKTIQEMASKTPAEIQKMMREMLKKS